MSKEGASERIGVILAGGGSRRMEGRDKATVDLAGKRLVDHVIDRLAPQADRLLISGARDYVTGLTFIADRDDGPSGPAAGLWAAAHWIEEVASSATGFVTAPVDGPFLPTDLFEQLAGEGASAVACTKQGIHPTFAYWQIDDLLRVLGAVEKGEGLALHELAKRCNARRVSIESEDAFFNVNAPSDLKRAEALAKTQVTESDSRE